jgi:UDP-N-acetylmuramoyl-tripeptide--D-alanyl-D-alanine ligase
MLILSEIAKAVGGRLQGTDVLCESVGSDSRNIIKNQLFVAIKGERFDGNTFAEEAIKQGAAAVLISNENSGVTSAIIVTDTRLALGKLAKYWRQNFSLPLIAVTGSNGKTTVKEMIAAILVAAKGSVLATKGNLNNDIGMPLTLLKIRAEHVAAVIEMGMNHEGEIRYLTNIAQPNIAVINNAGTAHIGELGSREAIARAKGEIFEGLAEDGIAIINADNRFADYWKMLNLKRKVITFGLESQADISATYQMSGNSTKLALKTPSGTIEFKLSVLGVHNIQNALAASAACYAMNISNEDIARGLAVFGAVEGRLNWLTASNGAVVIDDTYNANPDSMKAAIDVLASQNTTKVFVMGDMAELGVDAPEMHKEIGSYAKQKGISHILTYGDLSARASKVFGESAQHFNNLEVLVASLKLMLDKNTTVLVKGSRFMQMEQVVEQLLEKNNSQGGR